MNMMNDNRWAVILALCALFWASLMWVVKGVFG